MKNIQLEDQQWAVIGSAIDAAIKAGGVQAAVVLVPVFQEIESQLQQQQPTKDPQ